MLTLANIRDGWMVGMCLMLASCLSPRSPVGQNPDPTTVEKSTRRGFVRPEVPQTISDPKQRASWIVQHYWDLYDFRDTAQLRDPEIAEQAFVNFIGWLPRVDKDDANKAIGRLIDSATVTLETFEYFTDLAEKYFYEPNSPYRCDEAFIAVLNAVLKSSVDSLYKIRPRYQLRMILKNRPGEKAADFRYITTDGKQGRLNDIKADYTLLFFHDPECPECNRIKEYMASCPVFESAAASSKLVVLGLYLDENVDAWRRETHPAFMLNARDMNREITDKELYDIRAIPTLYLLDSQKRVILRDIPIEHIAYYLTNNQD